MSIRFPSHFSDDIGKHEDNIRAIMRNPLSNLPIVGKLFSEPTKARTYHGIDSVRRRASFFYYPLRAFFRAVATTQHAEIQAIGVENIPPDGAVFLVGNHPNSYLDFLNLSVIVRHPIATAAKDTITNTPVAGKILRDYALLVPVSRAQDKEESGVSEKDRQQANEQMVDEAVDLLVRGRLFNIYAEGRSTDSRRLNKIKLGFMLLAIQAEKSFNFNLNLRIVPYGYFYDRINKFQSSVCVIFGKPFKIKNLIDLPADFLARSEKDQLSFEKKLMMAGKERLQSDIERLIISIKDPKLVSLIDGITAIYVLSPGKYMGVFENVREKYVLCKTVSETIQKAAEADAGKKKLDQLRVLLKGYQTSFQKAGIPDALVRREYTWSSVGFYLTAIVSGILLSPFILYGYFANFIPRQTARLMRFYVINVKKRPQVDGDEQSILAAAGAAALTYPIALVLFYKWMYGSGIAFLITFFARSAYLKDLAPIVERFPGWIALFFGCFMVYLMARLWRFSLFYGRRFKTGLHFLSDCVFELFRHKRLRDLRMKRAELIDAVDFLIGDYYD
ncbi:MAG: 1-acyl-sn-glycerol-3-phosphate acyltransferase [Spirochaetia bacterium]|nr:1-acyl-sn-glycerol-3-phosphate acyltransferase [Spirochaetia bacterium]